MNSGKTIFSQIMDFVPQYEFRKCIERYNGNYKVQSFSCWDQFLCMAFAQLTYRESLRDIEACLRAFNTKLYHVGLRGKIARSTLADANENRDWRIYGDFAQALIMTARRLYAKDDFGIELRNTVYALDAADRLDPTPSIFACHCFPGPGFANTRAQSNFTRFSICEDPFPPLSLLPMARFTMSTSSTN